METNNTGTVQYDRWNESNINMNVEASQSTMMRVYNRMCTGTTGIIVKAGGALVTMVVIYIMGYATGYYVHRC
ncbi:small integral membrane protein 1 [Scomber scombrus]